MEFSIGSGCVCGIEPTVKDPSSTVSVVIAAYNAAGFIARAVASACAQGASLLEVLVVDDASTDDTCAVVRRLCAVDPRVRLIARLENGGPSVTRNLGFAAAAGRWIAVLDADDAFAPGRLERLTVLADQQDADMAADNVCYFDARAERLGPPQVTGLGAEPSRIDLATFLDRARPYTGEMDWGLLKPMFRRDFLRQTGLHYPTTSRHGEDFLFVVDALLAGALYVLDPSPGYYYTTRESGMSRTRIDYVAMARQTEVLRLREEIARDPILARRLRTRARAVRRLAAERDFDLALEKRDVSRLMRAALSHSHNLQRAIRLARSRLVQRSL